MTAVVVSVPFDGPTGGAGRDCAEGARLAARDAGHPVEVVVLDAGAGPFGRNVAANARRAAADPDVVAYLGDFHSAATEVSLPILEAAGVPQISFSNTLRRLVGRSFVNVMPHDERQTSGLVAWMLELGVERPFLLDDGEDYGMDMRWLVHRALDAAGRRVAGAARLFETPEPPAEVAGADGVFLGAVAGARSAEILQRVRALAPGALLFGTDGLLDAGFARDAPEDLRVSAAPAPSGDLMARLQRGADAHAGYAYEAMALLLDTLAAAGPDRAAITARLRATQSRHSVLGDYDFDEHGASTLSAISRLRVVGGRFVAAG